MHQKYKNGLHGSQLHGFQLQLFLLQYIIHGLNGTTTTTTTAEALTVESPNPLNNPVTFQVIFQVLSSDFPISLTPSEVVGYPTDDSTPLMGPNAAG